MKFCLNCNSEYGDERQVCPKDGSDLAQKSQDPLLGTLVKGKYRVDSLIGKGAMGAVYRVVRQADGTAFALKVLHSFLGDDNESVIRFHREAKATITLDHPHIVGVVDVGVMPHGQPFIVMELLKGVSLERVLEQRVRMPVEEILPIVSQVCDALGAAHKEGIVHRDVKPDNIILEERGGRSDFVKVVDFGIAKVSASTDDTPIKLTRTGMICGTPAYISPEQIQGQAVDARSDVYSLGIVMIEMLTGRVPFMADELVKLLFMHVTEEMPAVAALCPEAVVSPSIERVIAKALAKNPDERQQSMQQLWDELDLASRDASYGEGYQKAGGVQTPAPSPAPAVAVQPSYASPPPEPAPAARAERSGRNQRVSGEDDQGTTRQQPQLRSYDSLPVAFRSSANVSPVQSSHSSSLPLWIGVGAAATVLFLLWVRPWADVRTDPGRLIEQGRPEEALLTLDKKKITGRLSAADQDVYDRAVVALAKKKIAVGQYESAMSLLKQVSAGSSQAPAARQLMSKIRRR